MVTRIHGAIAGIAALAIFAYAQSAQALTMKECSAKYQAAKSAGTLGKVKWSEFRKTECSSDAAALPAAAPTPAPSPKSARAQAAAPRGTAAAAGNAVFPTSVSSKYSSESPGKARMHTCLDQYQANKSGGGNGGLKWVQKGGGYYSQCNRRLSAQ